MIIDEPYFLSFYHINEMHFNLFYNFTNVNVIFL